jgi:hypothetical protein
MHDEKAMGEKAAKESTYFISAPEGLECGPGDTFTVVGTDPEGNLEVRVEHGAADEGEDWKSDMRKTVESTEEIPPTEEGEGY